VNTSLGLAHTARRWIRPTPPRGLS